MSSIEDGSLLTCRKRNMLSGLRWEGRGIGGREHSQWSGRATNSTHFFFIQVKLFLRFRGFIARPTHDRLAALRQASRIFPEREIKGGGTTWPASHFLQAIPQI